MSPYSQQDPTCLHMLKLSLKLALWTTSLTSNPHDATAAHAQPLQSAASLLALMERHGIANAKTVVPADEVAEASTAAGEAPDAATLRPPQGSSGGISQDEGSAPPAGKPARAITDEGASEDVEARADAAQQLSNGSADAGGAEHWQLQPPPASASLPPAGRSGGGGAGMTSSSAPATAASPVAESAAEAVAPRGGGGAELNNLPDLGSGFGPADMALRRSASDAGGSGSWPPPSGVSVSGVGGSRGDRSGSGVLAVGGGGGQLRSRSTAPGPVPANGPFPPASLVAIAGAALDRRCALPACERSSTTPILLHPWQWNLLA